MRSPLSWIPAARRSRHLFVAAVAAASVAATGGVVVAAHADPLVPSSSGASSSQPVTILLTTPTPTPKVTPTPYYHPYTSTICVDPPQYTTPPTYTIKGVGSTSVISWFTGGGCWPLPLRLVTEVDGNVVDDQLTTSVMGDQVINGLSMEQSYRVKITATFANPSGGGPGQKKVLGDFDLYVPRVYPPIEPPIVTPTPTPTPSPTATPTPAPPTPTPTPTPTPAPPTPTPVPPTPRPTQNPVTCSTPGVLEPDTTFVNYPYVAKGTAALKTLTKGSLPLSGELKVKLCLPSQAFLGDLTLAPTQGNLVALGFLPVTAKLDITQTERVSGSIRNLVFRANAKVRIKLPSVKALGIELAGGANCQAKQVSSIDLQSTEEEFLPTEGGPIAGAFSISNLTGCGFLTNLVSPLTQGSGNAVALNLTNP